MLLDERLLPTETVAPWPEIDRRLVGNGRSISVPFPLDLLPGRWRAWVEGSAQGVGPIDFLAQVLFGAVLAMCGGGLVARVTKQWAEPLVLWLALAGGLSNGKSPALAAGRWLLANPSADQDSRAGDGSEGGNKIDREDESAVQGEQGLHQLVVTLGHRPQGVAQWREDLAGWLAEAGRPHERAGWLAGWSAGEVEAHRPGHWSISARFFPLGIVGGLRPEAIGHDPTGGVGQLVARFLYAWPQVAWSRLGEVSSDNVGVRLLLRRIAGRSGGAEAPSTLRFAEEAVELLDLLMLALLAEMQESDGLEAAWIGKGPGNIVGLAALLSLITGPNRPMGRATRRVSRSTPRRSMQLTLHGSTIACRRSAGCLAKAVAMRASVSPAASHAGSVALASITSRARTSAARRFARRSMPTPSRR